MRQARHLIKWLEGQGLTDAASQASRYLQYLEDKNTLRVLDLGSVTLMDYMGDDLTVVNAARVSFSKHHSEFISGGGKGSDDGLINFLALHKHWTPFGQPVMQFRMKMPIFVARQFMRSNIGIVYNETSRRYITDPPEFYYPTEWREKPKGSIKQGSGDAIPDGGIYSKNLEESVKWAVEAYNRAINDGVSPELARMVLPQNMYTEFVASMTLAAILRVIELRTDSHAQQEVQVYGQAILKLAKTIFPASVAAHRPSN